MDTCNDRLKHLSLGGCVPQNPQYAPPYPPNPMPPSPHMEYYYDHQYNYSSRKHAPCPSGIPLNQHQYPGQTNITWLMNSSGILVPTYPVNTMPMNDPRMYYGSHNCAFRNGNPPWSQEYGYNHPQHRCLMQSAMPHYQGETRCPAGSVTNEEINFEMQGKMLSPSSPDFCFDAKGESECPNSPIAREERYESCDSGIAESSAVSSEASWGENESLSEFETHSEKMKMKNKYDLESLDSSSKDAFDFSDDFEKEQRSGNAGIPHDMWTTKDDKTYWASIGRSPPSNYTLAAIAKQVDFYLSDEYLLKDRYLLRQVQCKKDRCVSIKLITSFKKIKKFTRDWAVVRSAILQKSLRTLITKDGMRIFRKDCLAENLQKPRLLNTVMVIRLPPGYNSVDKITSLFAYFGEISSVRLLRTNKEVPADLRNYATQVHDIGKTLCAVVEFESPNDALISVRVLRYVQQPTSTDTPSTLSANENDEEFISSVKRFNKVLQNLPALKDTRLALLGPRIRRTLYRQDRWAGPNDTKPVEASIGTNCVNKTDSEKKSRCHSCEKPSDKSNNKRPNKNNDQKKCDTRLPSEKQKSAKCGQSLKNKDNTTFITRTPHGPDDTKGFRKRKNSW